MATAYLIRWTCGGRFRGYRLHGSPQPSPPKGFEGCQYELCDAQEGPTLKAAAVALVKRMQQHPQYLPFVLAWNKAAAAENPDTAGYGAVEQDYYVQLYPLSSGGGLGSPLIYWNQGPGLSLTKAWIEGVRQQFSRTPSPGVTGFFAVTWAFLGYPVQNWQEKSREYVYPYPS